MIRNLSILTVDDDKLCQNLIGRVFGIYNDFHTASCLGDARMKLGEHKYDLLLLDRSLPDGDGLDLIQEALLVQPHLTVIVVTGEQDMHSVARGLANGAHDYLFKSDRTLEDLLVRIPVALSHALAKRRSKELDLAPRSRLPATLQDLNEDNYKEYVMINEHDYFITALKLCAGDSASLAQRLGISRSTAFKKTQELKRLRQPEGSC